MVKKAQSAARRVRRGFSLLELMLVLAIMGILMSVVAYNVIGAGDKAEPKTTGAYSRNGI